MIPNFPDFKSVDLSDREEFERALAGTGTRICELAFANLYAWQDFDGPELTRINGNICVRINPFNEKPFFLEPLGNECMEGTLDACLSLTGRLSRVSAGFAAKIDPASFSFEAQRDHFDYVYSVRDLAELKGRRFDGKRNHISRFVRAYPDYERVDLRRSHGKDAVELFREWSATKLNAEGCRLCGEQIKYDCQRKALERAFGAFDELGLFGTAIFVKDRLVGFMLACDVGNNVACMPFAYYSNEFPGISQLLLWETCRSALDGFTFVNLEQDLGIPGLRRSKESYYPLKMEEKFDVRKLDAKRIPTR